MPHAIVNYSANLTGLEQDKLLKQINSSLLATDLFSANDIKTRIFKDEFFLVGLGEAKEAYLHLKLYLLSGRTDAQKQLLGEQLLEVLNRKAYLAVHVDFPIQCCVEVIDMPREYYFKATI